MIPYYHERQILRPIVGTHEPLMRVQAVQFNDDPAKAVYVIAPCESEPPYLFTEAREQETEQMYGSEVKDRFVVVGDAPT